MSRHSNDKILQPRPYDIKKIRTVSWCYSSGLQWRNRSARGTYKVVQVEQCRGCEFEPHLEQVTFRCHVIQMIKYCSQGLMTSKNNNSQLVEQQWCNRSARGTHK